MKPLLLLTLLTSTLPSVFSRALVIDNTSIAPRGQDYRDAFGPIPGDHFSFWIHSQHLEFYSSQNSTWYDWGHMVYPCAMADVHPFPTAGWKNVSADDWHVGNMPFPFWFHPGNQCSGAHTRGQQMDNVWVWYKPAHNTPGANFINVVTDERCQEVPYHNISPTEWQVVLAYRCVLPLGVIPKDKKKQPHVGHPLVPVRPGDKPLSEKKKKTSIALGSPKLPKKKDSAKPQVTGKVA